MHVKSYDESLVSEDEIVVSREAGNCIVMFLKAWGEMGYNNIFSLHKSNIDVNVWM